MNKRYIVFQLNKDWCALDMEDILEITTLESMVKTNTTELNVVNWEGRAVPVVDPYAMLTYHDHKPTPKSRIAMVKKQGKEFGILFDAAVGVAQVAEHEIEEPMINEPRYVKGVVEGKFKIFHPEALLTKTLLDSFYQVYALNMEQLDEGIRIHGQKAAGQEALVDMVRLRSLNWLVRASKKMMEEPFLTEMIEIHDLVAKL